MGYISIVLLDGDWGEKVSMDYIKKSTIVQHGILDSH